MHLTEFTCRESLILLVGLHTWSFWVLMCLFKCSFFGTQYGWIIDQKTFPVQENIGISQLGQIKPRILLLLGGVWHSSLFLSSLCPLPLSSLPNLGKYLDGAQILLFIWIWKGVSASRLYCCISCSLSMLALSWSCCCLSCQQHKSSIKSISNMLLYLT